MVAPELRVSAVYGATIPRHTTPCPPYRVQYCTPYSTYEQKSCMITRAVHSNNIRLGTKCIYSSMCRLFVWPTFRPHLAKSVTSISNVSGGVDDYKWKSMSVCLKMCGQVFVMKHISCVLLTS